METLEREVWLYTLGERSVRITRGKRKTSFAVAGPGFVSHSHDFSDAPSLEEFLGWYIDRLEQEGWVLHATVDRRRNRRSSMEGDAGMDGVMEVETASEAGETRDVEAADQPVRTHDGQPG